MQRRQKNTLHTVIIALETLIVFLVLFLGVVIYANWGAFKNEIAFAVQPKSTPTPTAVPSATPEPIHEPAHVIIPKINVDAPIQWDIAADQTIEALNSGVAHLAGTAKSGQNGNTFITGHSSDFVWKQNPYAAVFSLVPKLTAGDEITIRENGKAYVYKVIATRIVKPDQVEVTNQTPTPVLTLMTCYPVGSTKERYIVHAALVSSPDKITKTQPQQNQSVPTIKFR